MSRWMRPGTDELAFRAGEVLPTLALKPLLGASLASLSCALCLHRVAPVMRATDWQPGLNMPASEIDALIELLLSARPGSGAGWLTVSFDDGYADAADYLRTRAARFPQVEFLFFVCPEKLDKRAGFRWDLAEQDLKGTATAETARAITEAPIDALQENERRELKALATMPAFRLAEVDEVRDLMRHPNVAIGNHTNLHLSATHFDEAVVDADYKRSTEDFMRLFGQQRHFAFPYGTPRYHFGAHQVQTLRSIGDFLVWTTEARPFRATERRPRGVLPRFAVNGTKTANELAGWIATRSLLFRARGTRHQFGE